MDQAILDQTFNFHCACGYYNCDKDAFGEPWVILQIELRDGSIKYVEGVYRLEGFISVKFDEDDEQDYKFVTKDLLPRDPRWFREIALNMGYYIAERAWTFISRIPLAVINNQLIFTNPENLIAVITPHTEHNHDHRHQIEDFTNEILNKCVTMKDYYIGLQHA